MAIDPTLLMFQQARAAAAAAGQQQEGSSTTAKEEESQQDVGQGVDSKEHQAMDPQLSCSSMSASAAVPAVNGGPTSPQPALLAAAVASTSAKTDSLETAPVDLRDDAELAAFLAKMDEYEPILPDSVTRFYLEKAGFQSSDDRVYAESLCFASRTPANSLLLYISTRMLGLAAQKFVSDIAKDAYAFARTRTTAGPGRHPAGGSTQAPAAKNKVRPDPPGLMR